MLTALRARRVYATSGPRILLRARLGSQPMGSSVPSPGAAALPLVVTAFAPEPIESIDVIRSGSVVQRIGGGGPRELRFERMLENLAPGEYVYVRVVQVDRGLAWSSPFFIVEPGGPVKRPGR